MLQPKLKEIMKSVKLSIVVLLLLGAVSCKKSTNAVPALTPNVSNSEAADIVASSISLNTNGVTTVSDDATNVANSQSLNLGGSYAEFPKNAAEKNRSVRVFVPKNLSCGDTKKDSITRQSISGAAIGYSYSSIYSFTLNCKNNVPDSLNASSAFSGTYSGPIITSVYTGSANMTVSGLQPAATNFTINGNYQRTGNFKSKKDTTNSGTHTVNIVVTNLSVVKAGRTIAGGSATITVTGNVVKKGNWTYTGTIVFNNDGTATLTLNNVVYTITLNSGLFVLKA